MPPRSLTDLPLRPAADGVHVAVRLTPRGRGNRLDGIAHDADGMPVLKASVAAPPAEGRANEALLQLLAKEWHLPRRDLAIVRGAKSRLKLVHIAGDAAVLLRRLAAALGELPTA